MIKESIVSRLAQIERPEQSNIVLWPYKSLVVLPEKIHMQQMIVNPYSKSLGVINQRRPTKNLLLWPPFPPIIPNSSGLKPPPPFMDVRILLRVNVRNANYLHFSGRGWGKRGCLRNVNCFCFLDLTNLHLLTSYSFRLPTLPPSPNVSDRPHLFTPPPIWRLWWISP